MDLMFRQFQLKDDFEWLYDVFSNGNETSLFIHNFGFSMKEEFEKLIYNRILNDYYKFYVILDSSGEKIGFIYAHEYRQTDLHIKFSMYILPKFRNLGCGAVCAIKFVDMLFRELPIKKVYETIFSTNKISLTNNLKAGFTKEATLKNYIFDNGKFCDLIYLSITREKFYKLYKGSDLLKDE